jgi:thymidylate synthase (FAD)
VSGKVGVDELEGYVKELHRRSLGLYETLLEAGVCREQARGVLPQNMYTQYYGTANLGNLLKFIDLRIHEGAQWEIQQVAKALLKMLEELYPVTVSSYRKIREESEQ